MAPLTENVNNHGRNGVYFTLETLSTEELSKLLDIASTDNVCVVSIIGKSSQYGGSCKAKPLHEATGINMFRNTLCQDETIDKDLLCRIEGFYDKNGKVIFLQLIGVFDTSYLIKVCKEMEKELHEKSFLEVWTDLQITQAKALLLLFQISHIIVVAHPSAVFDVSYIYLFRTLDIMRQKAVPCLSEVLGDFPIAQEWVQAGRPCSPRLLFLFQTCPIDIKTENERADVLPNRSKSPPIKKLEHSLEDQIYHILRKSRVITNVSGNSLFAVPANQEFVYVITSERIITDYVDFFLNQLKEHSLQTKDQSDINSLNSKSKSYTLNRRGSNTASSSSSGGISDSELMDEPESHSFRSFLWQHINLALTKGFDDNVGRHPVPAYFELPSAKTWFQIAAKLREWFLEEPTDSRAKGIMSNLKSMLDIDVRFSEGRCGKVLPMATAAYQDNLPTHYTKDYHTRKLLQAVQVFTMQARGPAFARYINQLKEDCDRLWQNGHQMCEELSLTGNHCINPLHRLTEDGDYSEAEKLLPVMNHFSQVKLISACDCGRRQLSREDPFQAKVANHDFYLSLHKECCGTLERVHFPVFEPSTGESRPAFITPSPSSPPRPPPLESPDLEEVSKDEEEDEGETQSKSQAEASHTHSTDEVDQPEDIIGILREDSFSNFSSDHREPVNTSKVVISILEDEHEEVEAAVKCEKVLTKQPSTVEYLPGMLHSESPPGHLPMFESWSLVCLGPSSLYSHNIGIQEQPGFLSGTNFLLPWDVTVNVEQKDRWNSMWDGKKLPGLKSKKGGRDGSQFTVKIFIGVEYECPRSHRFMCSAPDKVLRPTGTGLIKDNANKVTGSDMPLYFPCPCRPSKPNMAQLMRIHVVTPKAPVQVTLNPKVQPGPSPSPIFFPGNDEPLKLSQSAYWVLRLPLVYMGDQGPYLPPKEPVTPDICRLMKGTYGIAQFTTQK